MIARTHRKLHTRPRLARARVDHSDPLVEGLAHWWPGCEGVGQKVSDLIGGVPLNLQGSPAWVPMPGFGPSWRCDGGSNTIYGVTAAPINLGPNWLIHLWLWIDPSLYGGDGYSTIFGGSWNGEPNGELYLLKSSGTLVYYEQSTPMSSAAGVILPRVPLPIALARRSDQVVIYVGGVPVGTHAPTGYASLAWNAPLYVGRADNAGDHATFPGAILDVKAYSGTFPDRVIADLAARPLAPFAGPRRALVRASSAAAPPPSFFCPPPYVFQPIGAF